MSVRSWRQQLVSVIGLVGVLAVVAPVGVSAQEAPDPLASQGLVTPFSLVDGRDVGDRLPQPEDRYAMAGGCYTVEAPGAGWVTRDGSGLTLAPESTGAVALHFQATKLGEYLLATNEGPSTDIPDAFWDDRGFVGASPLIPAEVTDGLLPVTNVLLPGLADVGAPVSDTLGVAALPAKSRF